MFRTTQFALKLLKNSSYKTANSHRHNLILVSKQLSISTKVAATEDAAKNDSSTSDGGILRRFIVTAEVTASKIFPAGFGWQYGSVIAGNLGYAGTDLGFALATGVGDATGVFLGHTLFYAIKSTFDSSVKMSQEVQTGVFLGSAAFCSGGVWQPLVNLFQLSGQLPFEAVATGAGIGCTLAFFGGLRGFRMVYSNFMDIEAGNYANLKKDASLSVAIGGASFGFVGTDVNYLAGEGNFLRPLVGVEAADSVITGCIKAGSSTALGFAALQSAQNVTFLKGKNWTD